MTDAQLAAQARVLYPTLAVPLASGFADLSRPSGPAWPAASQAFQLAGIVECPGDAEGGVTR